MRSRIMVIGRDVEQRARLARLLNAHDYRVEIAESAAHACRIGFKGIALAIVAPDGLGPAGHSLLPELRAAVPNVLLVGTPDAKRDWRPDLIEASDEDALLARVAEALVPAGEAEASEPVLHFGGYRLDLGGHSLTDRSGKEVALTNREFSLLRLFVQRAGRVLSRDQLLRLLAGRDAETFDRSIDMQIVRLRRKIEPDPKRPTLIVTVPGSGYKFATTVRQTEAAAQPERAAAGPAANPHTGERRYVTALAAEVLAAEGTRLPDDPEELRALVDPWRRYAATIVARHGGVVAGSRLREVLAYFGYPVAQEHAAERALHAALAMAKRSPEADTPLPAGLAVRIGVASGLIVADTNGEVLGEAPGEAARLLHLAGSGQVIIAPSTRRLAGDLFAYRELGPPAVEGVAGALPVSQVLGESALGSRSEALYATAVTPLVGRAEELNTLLRAWRQAKSGEGRLVHLCGEPGIGKSRLLTALEEQLAAEPHTSLRYFCSPLRQDSALHPIVARWEQEAGFAHGDTADERLHKLQTIVAPGGLPSEDVALIAAMLSVPTANRNQQPELTPQQRKERTLAALLRRLEGMTDSRPVLMLFEDAQWADPSSLELLDILIDRLARLPILLIISFRTEFVAPWIGRAGTNLIALSRLNRKESETLAQATADRVLGPDLLQRIVAQTDGVPLFIEELTKAVLETSTDHNSTSLSLAVPNTLQASLMARLDRLSSAREVAQIGAVIGREFSHALLIAAALLPETQIEQGLGELVASGLAARRGAPPDAVYTFNHALTRDVAYTSLLRGRRQIYHQRIATALEEFDGGFVRATEPELLAYHHQQAGNFSAALAHWIEAGDLAEQRGANAEAVAHYQSAKALTGNADLSAADRGRAAEVLLKLGNAQWQTAGYQAEEVMRSYRDARQAALALDQQDEAAEAGIRISLFLLSSCRHRDVLDVCGNILCGQPDRLRSETLVHLWMMIGGAHCQIGDFQQSLAFSEKAIALDDQVNCTHKAPWAGADPAIVARDLVEMAARPLGYLDRSLAASEHAMAIALERGHQFSIVWASVARILALTSFGRYAEAVACADNAIAICEKHGFDTRIGNVLQHRGPALFELGDEERGLADIQQGVALWRERNGIFFLSRNLAKLAEYQLRANQPEQARLSLDEAEQLAATTDEKMHLAEIIRLRGRLSQVEGDHGQARLCFERAIAQAREQGARLFELNAARDLAKLDTEAGVATRALNRLRAVVDWFPATLNVPVLAECRALLQ
jgi:DNA-binding response OmpR family regulator/class 3 adenylate cyclase/tetratricopeptide (TPR) repeat protein